MTDEDCNSFVKIHNRTKSKSKRSNVNNKVDFVRPEKSRYIMCPIRSGIRSTSQPFVQCFFLVLYQGQGVHYRVISGGYRFMALYGIRGIVSILISRFLSVHVFVV